MKSYTITTNSYKIFGFDKTINILFTDNCKCVNHASFPESYVTYWILETFIFAQTNIDSKSNIG